MKSITNVLCGVCCESSNKTGFCQKMLICWNWNVSQNCSILTNFQENTSRVLMETCLVSCQLTWWLQVLQDSRVHGYSTPTRGQPQLWMPELLEFKALGQPCHSDWPLESPGLSSLPVMELRTWKPWPSLKIPGLLSSQLTIHLLGLTGGASELGLPVSISFWNIQNKKVSYFRRIFNSTMDRQCQYIYLSFLNSDFLFSFSIFGISHQMEVLTSPNIKYRY